MDTNALVMLYIQKSPNVSINDDGDFHLDGKDYSLIISIDDDDGFYVSYIENNETSETLSPDVILNNISLIKSIFCDNNTFERIKSALEEYGFEND